MSDEKKTRQRLTITAMYEAIMDIDVVLTGQQNIHRSIELEKSDDSRDLYVASLQRGPDGEVVEMAEHKESFEDAVAFLLTGMKEKFERYREDKMRDLDGVLDRHHGALRGARSKIRERKA